MVAGAPRKYKKSYPKELFDYFNIEPYEYVTVGGQLLDGKWVGGIREKYVARWPSIERWCSDRKIVVDTFYRWVKEYPKLSETWGYCRQLRQDILVTNALTGGYKENFSKFMAVNCTNLRENPEPVKDIDMDIKDIDDRLRSLLAKL